MLKRCFLTFFALSFTGLVACTADTADEETDEDPEAMGSSEAALSLTCQRPNGSFSGRDCHTVCGAARRLTTLNQNGKYKTVRCQSGTALPRLFVCCDVS